MKQELFHYQLCLKKPICINNKKLHIREGLVLKLQKKDGSIGYGDICPLPFINVESLKQAYTQLQSIDFSNLEKIDMYKLFPSVSFALQSALTPFCLRPISLPYCSLISGDKDNILSQVQISKAKIIKIKISTLTNTQTIAVMQKALEKNQTIRIDCNRKWSYQEALTLLNLFSKTDFEYIEEPCKTKEESLYLAKTTGFPIALDESIKDIGPSEMQYVRKIVFKPTAYHLFPWIKNKPIVFSSSFESGLGLSHILSMSYQSSCEVPGVDTYKYLQSDILKTPLSFSETHVTLKPPELNMDRLCPVFLM